MPSAEPVVVSRENSGVPAWVWIAGSVVLVGGGVGGYFLLKPDSTKRYESATAGSWGIIDL